MSAHIVAVVAFDRISPFHLSVPCVVFGEPRPGVPPFDLRVCATEPGPLHTTAGFRIAVDHGLEAVEAARTIIVPSWRMPHQRPPQTLLDALVAAHRRGARLLGLCLGAFALAETGLLDGRRATTHWACAADFAARFPAVALDPEVLYLEEDNILTSAGTTAGLDCCLHVLRSEYGAEIANTVARRLVMAPHRRGGQAQFIERPLPSSARDTRLAGLLEHVRASLDRPHTLDSLAAQACMSRRSLTRHFRQLTGSSVSDWLLAQRLALSQRLLESSDQSIERIAALAGFGSPVSLRHHFSQAFGVSPRAWRETFRGE